MRTYSYYVCCPKCHNKGSEGRKFTSKLPEKYLPKYNHWSCHLFSGLICGIPLCCTLYYTNLNRKGYIKIALMNKVIRGFLKNYKGRETIDSAYNRLSKQEQDWVNTNGGKYVQR